MMKNLIIVCLLTAAVFGWSAGEVAAQGVDRAGTASSDYLLLPLTARTAGLGAATTSGLVNMTGVEALHANPAALTVNTGTTALFSRMNYVADIGVNYFGIGHRFGPNHIALNISTWDFGDIARQTEDVPSPTDARWTAQNIVVGATYARQFTDRIAAGITAKAISERIDDVNAAGLAFDAGMTYEVGETGLRFGVSLRNFGPQMRYAGDGLVTGVPVGTGTGAIPVSVDAAGAEMPSVLNFGAAYTAQFAGDLSVTGLANFRSVMYDQDQYSIGVEAGFRNLVFARGGYQFTADQGATMFTGLNAGAGLNLSINGIRLAVDYGYRSTNVFGGINLLTVGVVL